MEGTVGGYWGVLTTSGASRNSTSARRVSNYPDWRLKAGLGIGAAFLVFAASWLFSRGREVTSWRRDLAVAAIALASGLVFGWAATGLPMEAPGGDRLRVGFDARARAARSDVARFAVARGVRLGGAERSQPARSRRARPLVPCSSALRRDLGGGDPCRARARVRSRYKDFQLALCQVRSRLSRCSRPRAARRPSPAWPRSPPAACSPPALFVIYNEGIANWQALWFGALLRSSRLPRSGPRPRQAEHEKRHGQRRQYAYCRARPRSATSPTQDEDIGRQSRRPAAPTPSSQMRRARTAGS